ncbi:MAG: hypothetical protein WA975_21540 [Mesorhizobium sp.]
MKSHPITRRHAEFVKALLNALREEFGDLPAEEMLAVASQIVGRMVALQDQRRFTPAAVMQIVSLNIEAGNRDIIDELASAQGGHA